MFLEAESFFYYDSEEFLAAFAYVNFNFKV